MSDSWVGHAEWWLEQVAGDRIYQLDVIPLGLELIEDGGTLLDLGCGEGQMMRMLRARTIGCDVSPRLLEKAAPVGPVVRCRLPDLGWLRPDAVDGAFAILVLEHLSDLQLFDAVARAVKPGGQLSVVMNHPAFTAEGAGPLMDPSDGEFLWRWGGYFEEAETEMRAGDTSVKFHHRPLAAILTAAAAAGWYLDRLIERGFSDEAVATEPGYAGQQQMPRLLGARWINTQGSRPSCR